MKVETMMQRILNEYEPKLSFKNKRNRDGIIAIRN